MTTDLELWNETARTAQPKWENRAKLISHFLRPGDTVLDLGAGDRKLRKYIPASCGYIPVDCTDALPGTFVVDFNSEFRLPDEPFGVIVSAGFIEYLRDLEGFLQRLSQECDGKTFYFTYSYRGRDKGKRYRKLNGFASANQCVDMVSRYASDVREIIRFGNQSLFSAQLSVAPRQTVRVSPINDALRRPSVITHILDSLRPTAPQERSQHSLGSSLPPG